MTSTEIAECLDKEKWTSYMGKLTLPLVRLETEGYVESRWDPKSEVRPRRRQYKAVGRRVPDALREIARALAKGPSSQASPDVQPA